MRKDNYKVNLFFKYDGIYFQDLIEKLILNYYKNQVNRNSN